MNPKEQGVNAENIFNGEATSEVARLVYKESTSLFSKAISQNLEPGEYNLADLGSHKGEFLQDLKANLTQYKFKTIAVDVNKDSLESNYADHKIISNIAEIDLADKSVDITIARYALAWNSIEDQKMILREIKRVTRHIAVVQHQGANSEQPQGLQEATKELFGGAITELKRDSFFFTTVKDIESFLSDMEIDFERIQNRDVPGLSTILIEKYKLSEIDAQKVRNILKDCDYISQSAWVLRF